MTRYRTLTIAVALTVVLCAYCFQDARADHPPQGRRFGIRCPHGDDTDTFRVQGGTIGVGDVIEMRCVGEPTMTLKYLPEPTGQLRVGLLAMVLARYWGVRR